MRACVRVYVYVYVYVCMYVYCEDALLGEVDNDKACQIGKLEVQGRFCLCIYVYKSHIAVFLVSKPSITSVRKKIQGMLWMCLSH